MTEQGTLDWFVEQLGPGVLDGTAFFAHIFADAFQTDDVARLKLVTGEAVEVWEAQAVGFNVALIATLQTMARRIEEADPLLLNHLRVNVQSIFGGRPDVVDGPEDDGDGEEQPEAPE